MVLESVPKSLVYAGHLLFDGHLLFRGHMEDLCAYGKEELILVCVCTFMCVSVCVLITNTHT